MVHHRRSSRVLRDRLLLNREHELSQLHHALEGALSGRGQVVLTAGEAGIGKTTPAAATGRGPPPYSTKATMSRHNSECGL